MTTLTHGHAKRSQKRSGAYTSWAQMRSRCTNPNVPEYAHYGARGITVCERWASFECFLADMGDRPHGMSIDRIDVNGNYEPANCKWATRFEQSRNTTRNRMVTRDGVTKPICDWIAELGLNKSTVLVRIHRGWPVERALAP